MADPRFFDPALSTNSTLYARLSGGVLFGEPDRRAEAQLRSAKSGSSRNIFTRQSFIHRNSALR